MVQQVFRDFEEQRQKIQNLEYDVLNLNNQQFEKDFQSFSNNIKDFDKRLSYVVSKGFQYSATAAAAFRLLESFESQVRRDIIKNEIEAKYSKLLHLYGKDLTLVYHIFNNNMRNPPVLSNLPRVAGTLQWVTGLIDRITWPFEKFSTSKV